MLSFHLLGQLSIYRDGTPLAGFRSRKEIALLAYLAHTGHSHTREFVADLLWGDRPTQRAMSNLRTVLTRLRKQVGDALTITRTEVALAPESCQQVDSAALLEALEEFSTIGSDADAQHLLVALETYRGEFLAGFHLADAPRFEAWAQPTRAHIHRCVLVGYCTLSDYFMKQGNSEQGIQVAQRWLDVDPFDDAAHATLVHLLLNSGQPQAAISHYLQWVELLHTELGVPPPEGIETMIRGILHSEGAAPPFAGNGRHALPTPHDAFIGRVDARRRLETLLDRSQARLITIVGQGGIGKTRLATTVARSHLHAYEDGVWFVDLAAITAEDTDPTGAIAAELATAMNFYLSGVAPPVEQLVGYLRDKRVLIVLDGAQHVRAGVAALTTKILRECEAVQIVVTSREPLCTRAEWVVTLEGLDQPVQNASDTLADAVSLFLARRAQVQPGPLSPDDRAVIARICRLVEGVPLAIELAASLTRDLTLREIEQALCCDFDTLESPFRDTPEAHRNLHNVFETSWRTLSPALQRCMARLAVFAGPFTAAAAHEVAQSDMAQLTALRQKSLVEHDPETGRYALPALVRPYAHKKRLLDDATPLHHARYYLAQITPRQEGDGETDAHARPHADVDTGNVSLAWQTALDQRWSKALLAALPGLSSHYRDHGCDEEGAAMMEKTQQAACIWGAGILAARAGLECARFHIRLGHYRQAIEAIRSSLEDARACGDTWAQSLGHTLWGEALWRLNEYDAARDQLKQALSITPTSGASLIVSWANHHLGIVYDGQRE